MTECILCKRKVLVVDNKNLCGECRASITLEVATRLDIIYLHYRIVQQSDEFEECLCACDRIIKEAEALLPYEELEVEVAPPLPSEIIEMVRELKDDLIIEQAERLLESQETNTPSSDNEAATVRDWSTDIFSRLQELKSKMSDPSRMNEVEEKLIRAEKS